MDSKDFTFGSLGVSLRTISYCRIFDIKAILTISTNFATMFGEDAERKFVLGYDLQFALNDDIDTFLSFLNYGKVMDI